MPSLNPALPRWAVGAAAPGAEVTEVRGLRDGGSPWLVQLSRRGERRGVVLRVGRGQDRSGLRTEVAALRLTTEHHLPAPRLLAAELAGDPPVVLVELLAGSSAIPPQRPPGRLRTLGRTAAALHAVALAPGSELPRRDRPIAGVDFAALRRQQPVRPLLMEAEERVAAAPPSGEADVFVHGDLWQGNALWTGDTLAGLVDWDCAGAGPPGVDLGSLRCDASVCFGVEAADDVQDGWEEVAGRPAVDVAYWDVVAALSTPPDMGGSSVPSPNRDGPTWAGTSWSDVATRSFEPPSGGWTARAGDAVVWSPPASPLASLHRRSADPPGQLRAGRQPTDLALGATAVILSVIPPRPTPYNRTGPARRHTRPDLQGWYASIRWTAVQRLVIGCTAGLRPVC